MDIGLFVPNVSPFTTPELLTLLGRATEERGFTSLWVPEHVVTFDEHRARYPYTPDGRMPMGVANGMLEPFTTLAFLASATSNIRLGTGIYILPQHNPVYTAKLVATLDWLSKGRVNFGVGVGWLEEEYEALAAPFTGRGRRCRSYVEVMQALWCDEVPEYRDDCYRLPACRHEPKPLQKPHPPIYFGGESDAALGRVAELGQGWLGMGLLPDRVPDRIVHLDKLLETAGRSRDEITVVVSPYLNPIDFGDVVRYREAGVDEVLLIGLASNESELLSLLDWMATAIVEPARKLQ